MDPALAIEIAAISRQKALSDVTERGGSVIQQFYENAVVFLTGGSGFLGKHLIEKLLRSTRLKKVFMLIRSKKGHSVQERLQDLLLDPLFDGLRKNQPDFLSKLVPVEGNIGEMRLGINDEDWRTITDEVDIIFHLAATTRFDEPLHLATIVNVRGTRELITLAKECRSLRSFVHVSTAYSHATVERSGKAVLENFYRAPIPPDALILMAENVDPQRISDLAPGLTKGWPNTYTFTKAVAEDLVKNTAGDLPVTIVRPGIVVNAYRDPIPGWIDPSNIYGASGIVVGIGLGIMHVVYANDETLVGIIPVDYVNNTILAACWDTVQRRAIGDQDMKIYNVISSTRNHISWKSIVTKTRSHGDILPTPKAIWAVVCFNTKLRTLFTFLTWLLHFIPAYVIDGMCWLLGKERRFVKIYDKTYKMSMALGYFTTHDWAYEDKNSEDLYEKMSTLDRSIYNFNIKDIDWNEFTMLWCVGIRKYLLKDELKGTEHAKRKQFWFQLAHYIIMSLYFYAMLKISLFILQAIYFTVKAAFIF